MLLYLAHEFGSKAVNLGRSSFGAKFEPFPPVELNGQGECFLQAQMAVCFEVEFTIDEEV